MRILFAVHAFVPNVGGSEYYVYNMAQEMLKRGHHVEVFAHNFDNPLEGATYEYQGIKVTASNDILSQKWDAIVVHGGDVYTQDYIHSLAYGPVNVVYMLIKPSERPYPLHGLRHHKWIAYSTSKDIEFIKAHNVAHKAVRMRHGIVLPKVPEVVSRNNVYVSAGGFWPHKGFPELAEAWERSDISAELHLYGYARSDLKGQDTDRVKWLFNQDQVVIYADIAHSKGYIMNSYEEGFGLVLLEAMALKTPWYARKGVGAVDDLANYGWVYEDVNELIAMVKTQSLIYEDDLIRQAYEYVIANHSIVNTCDDLEDILT